MLVAPWTSRVPLGLDPVASGWSKKTLWRHPPNLSGRVGTNFGSDSLYGMQPDPAQNFRVNLGAIAPRGKRHTLIVSLDALLRMSSNPFFPY
jgi:hypothetical protein